MVTGPRASQPPAATSQPAASLGAGELSGSLPALSCRVPCSVPGQGTEGPRTSEHCLGASCLLYSRPGALSLGTGPLPLVSQCGCLDSPEPTPFAPSPAAPSHRAHVAHSAAQPGTPSPLTFWSPRLALAPHSDATQNPRFLRGHLCSKETEVLAEEEEGKAHRTSAWRGQEEPRRRLGSHLGPEWMHPGQLQCHRMGPEPPNPAGAASPRNTLRGPTPRTSTRPSFSNPF